MISVLATNITSPLDFTTEQNYRAVRSGVTALKRYGGHLPLKGDGGSWNLPEPFTASLFSEEQRAALATPGYTFFEAIAIRSVREALSRVAFDLASPRVIFILSTTKGNIGQSPTMAAQRIAEAVGITTKPIVVCNACVSGLSAQLLADRLLSAGFYDYAIVVGAEQQSKFIVSGFQSLKAVSAEPCRPFDIERNGLNPGEAAATIVFEAQAEERSSAWHLVQGAVCNDAYHTVSPSPKAEGCARAIEQAMAGRDKSRLATVCVHGTATLFNDQMESVAIQKTGLSGIPLSALKGYFGHTMGAAGVLETIMTMCATDDGVVLPSKGFAEVGVSGKVSISGGARQTNGTSFLKLLSGFGGCNVAVLYTKDTSIRFKGSNCQLSMVNCQFKKTHTVRISSGDGKLPADIYKQQIGDYPKIYKMDILSRLAFVTAELLKRQGAEGVRVAPEHIHERKKEQEMLNTSIILFNHSSSIVADRQFLSTINDVENFFPSPSVFVYTLPNIAAGEIAIRHHVTGETSFYILPQKDEALMQQILEATLNATGARSVVSGWVDAESDTSFECELSAYVLSE